MVRWDKGCSYCNCGENESSYLLPTALGVNILSCCD